MASSPECIFRAKRSYHGLRPFRRTDYAPGPSHHADAHGASSYRSQLTLPHSRNNNALPRMSGSTSLSQISALYSPRIFPSPFASSCRLHSLLPLLLAVLAARSYQPPIFINLIISYFMHILIPMPIISLHWDHPFPTGCKVISRGLNGRATGFETILPSFSLASFSLGIPHSSASSSLSL